MNKTAIKNFAVWAREKLISDITYKAGMLGITETGIAEKLPQSSKDLHFFDIGTKNYSEISGVEIKQRDALVKEIRKREHSFNNFKEAFENLIEEVAYTWFNRLIAIRFMEVNDYLPSGIRVLSSENKAKNEPDLVTMPFDTDLEFSPYEQDRVIQLKDENKLDELFRMLFIKQCNKLHDILPELFEKTDDFSELLLTISFTDKEGIVYRLVHDIDEDDFNVEKEGQVEIIGWLYQYYNTELKADTFSKLKKNIKISKDRIPAATQLFTPHWIVQYMVENSLGRIWLEGHPNDDLKSNWKYYLKDTDEKSEVRLILENIRKEYVKLKPEEIRCIDPCCGSGHILIYIFDVLIQIYEAQGYVTRDAVRSIIENNLYGLDIDKRASQLAYFSVIMKGRQYDNRFFKRGVQPNVFAIMESDDFDSYTIEYFCNNNKTLKKSINAIVEGLKDAKEYGSILSINEQDWDAIYCRFDEIQDDISIYKESALRILPLVKVAETLALKYHVVVTNPPYMGTRGTNDVLVKHLKMYYPDSKADLFSAFIERAIAFLNENGIASLVTPESWMFIPSFEALRKKVLTCHSMDTILDLGFGGFDAGFGTVAFSIRKKRVEGNKIKAIDLKNIEDKEKSFTLQKIILSCTQEDLVKIPGNPFAYWVTNQLIQIFITEKTIGDYGKTRQGMATSDNNRFLRFWYEVNNLKIDFRCENGKKSSLKWFPYNKGGGYRKWYGTASYVINWENDGNDVLAYAAQLYGTPSRTIKNTNEYFKEAICWPYISSEDRFGARWQPAGFIFDVAGSSLFTSPNMEYYLCGFLSSVVAKNLLLIINPTINFQTGDIARVPLIVENNVKRIIDGIVKDCIYFAVTDWDSFETSWDFTEHPLVRLSKGLWDVTEVGSSMHYYYGDYPEVGSPLELCYLLWQGECNERFKQLKANEEELNRIFIEIYGLQDELSSEVEDKDVTVRKADLQRDIKSLISYAVGCILGRYSLDHEGLAFAGGNWDDEKYRTFMPDKDNCIPITDEEYFEDDIVGLFCNWLVEVYGEDCLEQNLDYIANALGNKGKTSREVIRNYFLTDFFKDHVKIYKKRPIYWLFDSGKQNGFKALCYMHRWNADTIGNMRVEYLHPMQRVYEKEIDRMQEMIDNSKDNKEIANATKRKEKLQKQIKETKEYDAKVAHLALSRIDIDLDDGVKVNYEKVQTASDGKKMQILAKI